MNANPSSDSTETSSIVPVLDAPAETALSPLPNESAEAFEALQCYFNLGPRRKYLGASRKAGVSVRTIKRWASDFAWRDRVRSCLQGRALHGEQSHRAAHDETVIDAAARVRSLRERQVVVAEAILDAAERYLEIFDADSLDSMSFAEACKALRIASQITGDAASKPGSGVEEEDRSLRSHLCALLDQARAASASQSAAAALAD